MTHLILNLFVVILMIISGESLNCLNEKWIEESLNKSHIPGAVIIVVNATDILYEQAFGYHSLFPVKLMDAKNSIFSIASISKTFIGTAVMQLVEEERVDLDTDINQYLNEPHYRIFHPNYPSHSLTLRRLLSHSSSIAVDEYLQLSLYQPGDSAFQQSTLADRLFNNLINSNRSSWLPKPPGSVTFYSNDGSSLAGLVVERVANMSFDKYVKEKILKPLNIDISKVGVRLADFENREELVKHYVYALNASILNEWTQGMPQLNVTPLQNHFPTWLNIPFFGFSVYPSGLFRISARSLSLFLRMFINNGSSLLTPRSIAEMKIVVGGGLIPYYGQHLTNNSGDIPTINPGLSWYWQKLIDGQRYIGHTGSLPGAVHWMFVNEKSNLGVIILTNGDANTPNDRSKVIHKLFENIHLELIQCFELTDIINSSASKINVTLFRFSIIAVYFHQIIILFFFNNFQDE